MTYKFTEKEYNKWIKGYQEVTHSTVADSLDEAVNNFYSHMKSFGWTKERIRKEIV